ncbi:hypothetical protein SAMD00019534_110350 [Acytostelium subglobosum LB1]|uniref:hypothetical protein n=1 Tax=Acytostelium subglobosum LB1 TaxID=1410327 RepID=UPI0006451F65|nr:hypothetical protein SAMD00019534_110350 [Acytostelium subglobosum LB1]GAM27859.1 hypothetical protein SAMD00019534_110350 [Acytostelium subglobosum LB1]|eukprot:XP_012749142.1 hypothetical protein SAMD00019534_110350 [Acytostelium subglobosum LB1]
MMTKKDCGRKFQELTTLSAISGKTAAEAKRPFGEAILSISLNDLIHDLAPVTTLLSTLPKPYLVWFRSERDGRQYKYNIRFVTTNDLSCCVKLLGMYDIFSGNSIIKCYRCMCTRRTVGYVGSGIDFYKRDMVKDKVSRFD